MTKIEEIMTGRKSPEDLKKGIKCAFTKKCIGEKCPYDFSKIYTKSNPLDIEEEIVKNNYNCMEANRIDMYRYIIQLEANQIKGRCKDCKHVVINTHINIVDVEMECGLIEAYECDASTTADGYCDEWEPKEDAHGPETGEKHETQEMADEGPGEAGTEPV